MGWWYTPQQTRTCTHSRGRQHPSIPAQPAYPNTYTKLQTQTNLKPHTHSNQIMFAVHCSLNLNHTPLRLLTCTTSTTRINMQSTCVSHIATKHSIQSCKLVGDHCDDRKGGFNNSYRSGCLHRVQGRHSQPHTQSSQLPSTHSPVRSSRWEMTNGPANTG